MTSNTFKRGAIPTPQSELDAAPRHLAKKAVPIEFFRMPNKLSIWGNDHHGDCVTAEEAFAKACDTPENFISDNEVIWWATKNNVLDSATLPGVMQKMQCGGFPGVALTYDDGPYALVDFKQGATLRSAISSGPVKTGVAADQIANCFTEKNGWFGVGFVRDPKEDHCVSLCGYGTLDYLARQLNVSVPDGVDGTRQGYAMFTWGTVGIVDEPSMLAVTAEAWLRSPTNVTRNDGLFVFHHGDANNHELWCTRFDGTRCEMDMQFTNVCTSDSPSAVMYQGRLYVFHQGNADLGDLWYSVLDGTVWKQEARVPNVGISDSPFAVVFNGLLYVFHQGYANNGELWYSVFDGQAWKQDVQVPNVGISDSPHAVVFNGLLYVLHQGYANNGELWYSMFDGQTWKQDVQVPNAGISDSPAAVVFNGLLYVFHQGYANNNELWYSMFDGQTWKQDVQVPNVGISDSPAAVVCNGLLYVFHQGDANNNELWHSVFDGQTWEQDVSVSNVGISHSPSAVYVPSQR